MNNRKWTVTAEDVDYVVGPDRKRVTTITSNNVEADRCEVQDGNLCFYNQSNIADDVLVFATNNWDKVELVTEE